MACDQDGFCPEADEILINRIKIESGSFSETPSELQYAKYREMLKSKRAEIGPNGHARETGPEVVSHLISIRRSRRL